MSDCVLVKGLFKNFGDVEALRGLNLRFVRGIFGFIGPNGAGKTTLIKILMGALRADEGEARVLGFDCQRESLEIRRRIGVSHEKSSFPNEATGLDYLSFIGCLHGLPKSEAKASAMELLSWMGLGKAAYREIGGYSAGMKQRLNFAQALLGRPELVILDEPTSNLDPLARMELLEKIRELHKEYGINFFISSHILPELEEVCEYVGILFNGVLIEQGKLDELAKKYFANIFKIFTPKPQSLLNKLQSLSTLKETRVDGDSLIVSIGDPDEFHKLVAQTMEIDGVPPRFVQLSGSRLKEVYRAVIKNLED